MLLGESNMRKGGRYTPLPDTAQRSGGFILSCSEGHELSKDNHIQVRANEVKSRPEPAERAGQWRTEQRDNDLNF